MAEEAVSTEGLTGYELRRVYRRDHTALSKRATAALTARHKGEMSQAEYEELAAIYNPELERLRLLYRRPRRQDEQQTVPAEGPFEFEF